MMPLVTPFTFNLKGTDYSSNYTDDEAYTKLAQYVTDGTVKGDFPRDLCNGYNRYRRFTPGQQPWVHKFVLDAERPRQNVAVGGFLAIVTHMVNAAASGMKYPQVRIETGTVKFTLKLAGQQSRNAGKVSVAESHRFGEGLFFGWIDQQGSFQRYGAATDELVAVLQEIAANPAEAINKFGLQSGHCCYCWQELTQVQSKIVGCGKTCGAHYNVDYPSAAETRVYVANHPEVLIGASDAERWTK